MAKVKVNLYAEKNDRIPLLTRTILINKNELNKAEDEQALVAREFCEQEIAELKIDYKVL